MKQILEALLQQIERHPELRQVMVDGKRQAEAERAERERQRGEFLELVSNDPVRQEGLQLLRDILANVKKEDQRQRLLRMSAAEAWMEEHPKEMNSEIVPTLRALTEFTRRERQRLKAVRAHLRELGIR